MKYRNFSNTGWKVSEIGLGCWAIGGSYTDVTEKTAFEILNKAVEKGVNFFDTSDAYGNGRSEKIIGKFLKYNKNKLFVATKVGTLLKPHLPELYKENIFEKFIDNSLSRLNLECIDLLQIHCPPIQMCSNENLYNIFENIRKKGKVKYFGISVFSLKEALEAIKFPNVKSVQLVFNVFRQKPAEFFLKEAKKKNIAIIARGPLANGLLTGTIDKNSVFHSNDHRNFNAKGQRFDIGDTFSGVGLDKGLKVVEKLKKILPKNYSLTDVSIKWILSHKEVTVVIPGATNRSQIIMNTAASKKKNIKKLIPKINKIYNQLIKPQVHNRW